MKDKYSFNRSEDLNFYQEQNKKNKLLNNTLY